MCLEDTITYTCNLNKMDIILAESWLLLKQAITLSSFAAQGKIFEIFKRTGTRQHCGLIIHE